MAEPAQFRVRRVVRGQFDMDDPVAQLILEPAGRMALDRFEIGGLVEVRFEKPAFRGHYRLERITRSAPSAGRPTPSAVDLWPDDATRGAGGRRAQLSLIADESLQPGCKVELTVTVLPAP